MRSFAECLESILAERAEVDQSVLLAPSKGVAGEIPANQD